MAEKDNMAFLQEIIRRNGEVLDRQAAMIDQQNRTIEMLTNTVGRQYGLVSPVKIAEDPDAPPTDHRTSLERVGEKVEFSPLKKFPPRQLTGPMSAFAKPMEAPKA